jgi:hypothetical protein
MDPQNMPTDQEPELVQEFSEVLAAAEKTETPPSSSPSDIMMVNAETVDCTIAEEETETPEFANISQITMGTTCCVDEFEGH